jgi:hypothetical protein
VTDSAGVEVVTNLRAPAFLLVRDLPPAPEREVVHDALYQVTALHAFDGGGVAVGASGSRAILVFDADGALVATLGRAGDGPGEFQGVGGIVPLPGDSLAVWDPRQQRLTVFPPEGGAPRVTSLADLIQGYAWSRLRPLDEGMALVGEGGMGGNREPGVYRPRMPAHAEILAAPDGSLWVAEYMGPEAEFPGARAAARSWMVFDAAGVLIHRVRRPPPLGIPAPPPV